MVQLKQAVFVGCVLGIVFAVLKIAVPDKKVFKSLRLVMSLVMLVSVGGILTKIEFSFNFDELTNQAISNSENLQTQLDEAYIDELERVCAKNINLYLLKNGVEAENIVIETYVDEYNYIEIKNIKLFIEKEDKAVVQNVLSSLVTDQTNVEIVENE